MRSEPFFTICVVRRVTDNDRFMAYIAGNKAAFAVGRTQAEAVGDLVIAHAEKFNIAYIDESE